MQLKIRAKMSVLKMCRFENKSATQPVLLFICHVSEDQNVRNKEPSPKLTAPSIVSRENRAHLFPLFIKATSLLSAGEQLCSHVRGETMRSDDPSGCESKF